MKENKSVFDNYSKEQLQKIIDESSSIREVILKVGLCGNGMGSYQTFYRKVSILNLNIIDLKSRTKIKLGKLIKAKSTKVVNINSILIENSSFSRVHLKEKLIKIGLLENNCVICGQLPSWNNKPLTLQLDHINGINNDNRIENLRILCPHCHSQQLTTGSKKLKLVKNKHIKMEDYKENLNMRLLEKQKESIEKIKHSDINFSKFGWVKKVAVLINKKHQKVNKWMKKYLPEIYSNAYKKQVKNLNHTVIV